MAAAGEASVALKRSWREISAVRLAVGLMVFVLVLFLGILAYFVTDGVQRTNDRLREQSSAASQVLATNAYWISEVANQTLRRVDTATGPTLSGSAADIEAVLQGLPSATEVYVIDNQANTVFSTVPGATGVDIGDREYYTAVRDGAPFYTSPLLVSRITDDIIFVFSKRVVRNGEFAGAIMVSFSGALLGEFFRTLELEPGSTLSLIRDDGQLMARYPPTTGNVDFSDRPLFTHHLKQSGIGTFDSADSLIDGVPRVVSYRRVEDSRIIAVAAVATSQVWGMLLEMLSTLLVVVSPVLFGLMLISWWILRLLVRDADRAKELEASVELNTMLFREIHHRVKNNLASVQALVRMQNIPDTAKRDLQSRFAAMAAMHEHIYQHDRYEDIDAHDFIPPVVDQVKMAYGTDTRLIYDLDHVMVDRDHATPLALLLSELATNAFKYAYADDQAGTLSVTLRQRGDGRAILTVRDDGAGMEPQEGSNSMGMRLIRGVVGQMGGEYSYHNDNGVVFEAELALSAAGRQAVTAPEADPVPH